MKKIPINLIAYLKKFNGKLIFTWVFEKHEKLSHLPYDYLLNLPYFQLQKKFE